MIERYGEEIWCAHSILILHGSVSKNFLHLSSLQQFKPANQSNMAIVRYIKYA